MAKKQTKRKVFVDTNVLLDVLLEREGFYYDALNIWAAAELGQIECYVSAVTLNNIYYIVRKLKSETTAMICVRIILRIFKVVPLDVSILNAAADFHEKDFEDDVQVQSAISVGCTELFTRDMNHFASSALTVLPPASFVNPES